MVVKHFLILMQNNTVLRYLSKKFYFMLRYFSWILYSVLIGLCIASDKELGYWHDGPGTIPGVGGDENFLHSLVTGPRVHSTFCKLRTGAFSGVKTAESRASHRTSSYFRDC